MRIIIPMAGSGQRFVDAGYRDTKPLIMIRGKRMIEYVCDMFDKDNDEFTFICNANQVRTTTSDINFILKKIVKHFKLVVIPPHKFGPVFSVISAINEINKKSPVIIAHCDTPLIWDYKGFKEFIKDSDGCFVSCTGFHPHGLSNTMWAHLKLDSNGIVEEVKEKACYTDNHMDEHASAGVYYFKSGDYVLKYFRELIGADINYNHEYYITLVYNLLIKDGLSVRSYLADYVLSFGTPADIRNYEAWQTILEASQVNNTDDLVNCYNYWKDVNNIT